MSAPVYLYHRHVSSEALPAAVDALRDRTRYVYYESEADIDLLAYRTPDPAWTDGRAFGEELEVRWEQAGDGFDLLALAETPLALPAGWEPVPADDPALPCPDAADAGGQVLLWGTHAGRLQRGHLQVKGSEDAWIETRIPRILRYPVTGSPRWVKARTVVYRYQGRPVLTRLAGLEGEDNDPQPFAG